MSVIIKIKRAYDEASDQDGYRILVDRLWPRGISKVVLHADEWAKDIAPTPALRTWFGHKPERWAVFQKRYADELVRSHKQHRVITLVYAAKNEERTHALVLQHFLEKKFNNSSDS